LTEESQVQQYHLNKTISIEPEKNQKQQNHHPISNLVSRHDI